MMILDKILEWVELPHIIAEIKRQLVQGMFLLSMCDNF